MPDINLVRSHSLSIAKAKALVQRTADGLATEHGLESEWHGNTLHFHRSGVDGQILVSDSKIELNVTLGLLMKPFKGKLADQMERELDKLLAEAEPATQAKVPAKRKARSG
jgi:putative polyhydroxyalkanoate system protein